MFFVKIEGVFYGIYFWSATSIFGVSIDAETSVVFIKLLLIFFSEISFFYETGNFEGSTGIINSGLLEIIKDWLNYVIFFLFELCIFSFFSSFFIILVWIDFSEIF